MSEADTYEHNNKHRAPADVRSRGKCPFLWVKRAKPMLGDESKKKAP